MQALVSWLVAAMLSWTPVQGDSPERRAQLEGVAQDIISVVYVDEERPLSKGPYARAHTALLIASVAALESRFLARIQKGDCRKGECDDGHATCFLQIHMGRGLEILENDAREVLPATPEREVVTAQDLLASQRTCFHVGLHLLRRALRFSGGSDIRAYTGETGEQAPKSDERMEQALVYYRKHPSPVADAEVSEVAVVARSP
jgi:hypothetical protein